MMLLYFFFIFPFARVFSSFYLFIFLSPYFEYSALVEYEKETNLIDLSFLSFYSSWTEKKKLGGPSHMFS